MIESIHLITYFAESIDVSECNLLSLDFTDFEKNAHVEEDFCPSTTPNIIDIVSATYNNFHCDPNQYI